MIRDKRILVAVLNWGLGHATRSIPIIRHLLEQNNTIDLASDGDALDLLKDEFEDLKSIMLPSYSIQYSSRNMHWNMASQFPHVRSTIRLEHQKILQNHRERKYEIIISDNRYGCHLPQCHNIFISHQLNLKVGILGGLINHIHRKKIQNFQEVWVPDYEDRRLSGDLSNPKWLKHLTVRWIGPQSRLKQIGSPNSDIDIAIVLSGPEPQRSNFEQKLIKQFSSLPHKIILVRGLRNPTTNLDLPGNTTILNYADAEILSRVINQSKFIICRSGYSTIMDLDNLGGKVLFVPTPGQPEQMYLAEYFEQKNIAEMQSQLNLDITSAWSRRNDYSGFPIRAILTSCCTDS